MWAEKRRAGLNDKGRNTNSVGIPILTSDFAICTHILRKGNKSKTQNYRNEISHICVVLYVKIKSVTH
jgi:hypothetical protein